MMTTCDRHFFSRMSRRALLGACMLMSLGVTLAQPLRTVDVSPDFPFGSPLDNLDGRIPGIVIDPTDDGTLYAAAEFTGIWKSVDGAVTWHQSSNGLRNGRTRESAYPNLAVDAQHPRRLLYASDSRDGRPASPCQGCAFGGLWVSVDAAASWRHVDLCSKTSRPDDISSVIFSAGRPFVATACGIWTTQDPTLLGAWNTLPPLPSGISPSGTILAPSTNPSATLFACLGGGTRVYRTTNFGQSWESGIDLGGGCTGLSAAPLMDEFVPSTSVVIHFNFFGFLEVSLVDHNRGTRVDLGFTEAAKGSGRSGVWVVPRPTNPSECREGPACTYDIYAADDRHFFLFRGSTWSNAFPIHDDTWALAFPSSYDSGAGFCPVYAANDGGVFKNASSSCFFERGGWVGASAGLHVAWGISLTGLSYSSRGNPTREQVLCQANNGGQPCPQLYLPTTDDDVFIKGVVCAFTDLLTGNCITPSFTYSWKNLIAGLGDAGEVLVDPAQSEYALACRNGNYHMFVNRSGNPPVFDTPYFDITPANAFQGSQDGKDQGINVIMTMPGESPAASGDVLAIVSRYRSDANNCQQDASCGDDAIVRNLSAARPSVAKTSWFDISTNARFGSGHVDGIQSSGGHANPTVYARTSNNPGQPYSGTRYGPGQIWKSTYPFTSWSPATGSGANRLARAYNMFVNPYDPDEIYATDLGGSLPTVKVSRDGGRSWSPLPELRDIATNHGEFDFDCGNFPFSDRGRGDKDILGNQCSLEEVVFVRDHPEIRVAVLYPGGLAFSRNGGRAWMPLDVTRAARSEQPIELPTSAFYDPWPNAVTNNTSLFVALQGKGVKRIDGPFATLQAARMVYCPICAGAPSSGNLPSEVNAVMTSLDTVAPLRLDADGLWRGTILFDGADVRTIEYRFVVDGQSTQSLKHHLDKAERTSGVVDLSNTASLVVVPPPPGLVYSIEDIGDLGGEQAEALGINDLGQAVGFAFASDNPMCCARGFRVPRNVTGPDIDFSLLSGIPITYAFAININGDVAGSKDASGGGGIYHAFRYANGSNHVVDLDPDPAANGRLGSHGYAISDTQEVVGAIVLNEGSAHAARFIASGNAEDLGTLGGNVSQALGVSHFGHIIGWSSTSTTPAGDFWNPGHAFLWQPAEVPPGMRDLNELADNLCVGGPVLSCWELRKATAINNAGAVVGFGVHDGAIHAFLFHPRFGGSPRPSRRLIVGGTVRDLGTFANGGISYALGLNDREEVVGAAYLDASGRGNYRAALFARTHVRNLGALIGQPDSCSVEEPAPSCWVLREATGINNSGQIVGWGTKDGKIRAYRLTPR